MKQLISRAIDRAAGVILRRAALAERTGPTLKAALRDRYDAIRLAAAAGAPFSDYRTAGFRVFSQCDEDGILLWMLAALGIGPARFVDIGGGDGLIASNCANLALNLGFDGAFIDADGRSIARGRRFYARHPDTLFHPPRFVQGLVTRENVNALVESAGITGEIDVLSIDIDGNDYWIWEALTVVQPRIVIMEAQVERGMRDEVMPYDANYRGGGQGTVGATAPALVRLADRLGYRLVAANRYGFNLFFVRSWLADGVLPTVTAESVLAHPRTAARAQP